MLHRQLLLEDLRMKNLKQLWKHRELYHFLSFCLRKTVKLSSQVKVCNRRLTLILEI